MTDRWTKADRRPAPPGWSLSARISDQDKGRERYKETGETERERSEKWRETGRRVEESEFEF